MNNTKKPIALTMGDASGVGPEIIIKGFAERISLDDVLVYGDARIFRAGSNCLGIDVPSNIVTDWDEMQHGRVNIRDFRLLDEMDWTPGKINTKAGAAAYEYIIQATRDAINE